MTSKSLKSILLTFLFGLMLALPLAASAQSASPEMQTDPRFKVALAIVERLNNPCTSQTEYKQFDFWVGEWVVTSEGQ